MILQYVVLIGMIIFCMMQYFDPIHSSMIYIYCPVLLLMGLGKRGVITWPIATILLLIQGHWIIGFIPALLVVFTIKGNEWILKKYPTVCFVCKKRIESDQEFKLHRGIYVHAKECFELLKMERKNQDSSRN